MTTWLAGMPVICSILARALMARSTGCFSVSSVTMAALVLPADKTSARTYRRVLTSEVFFGEGEPARVTSPVGVMSTMPTPALMNAPSSAERAGEAKAIHTARYIKTGRRRRCRGITSPSAGKRWMVAFMRSDEAKGRGAGFI